MLDLLNVAVNLLVFLHILDIWGSNLDSKMGVLTEVFCGFLHSRQEIAGLVTAIGSQLLPCKSSSCYSLIILSFDSVQSEQLQSLLQHLKFVDFINVLIMANKQLYFYFLIALKSFTFLCKAFFNDVCVGHRIPHWYQGRATLVSHTEY